MAEMYFDYEKMMAEIDSYMNKYPFVSVTGVCESILGHNIPAIILGEGERVITYIGGEEGCDFISSFTLLRFVRDICSLYEERGSAFGFSAENIFKNYTLVIIPMINPDGNLYCSQGIKNDNPLRERVLKLNNEQNDFSKWRGNARGVELKYSYSSEICESEPEPEAGAVSNFLRYGFMPDILVAFSQSSDDDGRVLYGEGETENKIATALSQMSGLQRIYRESKEPKLMLSDWVMQELGAAAFSIELPQFKYNTRKQYDDKSFSCYAKIRKVFFCVPFLNKIK